MSSPSVAPLDVSVCIELPTPDPEEACVDELPPDREKEASRIGRRRRCRWLIQARSAGSVEQRRRPGAREPRSRREAPVGRSSGRGSSVQPEQKGIDTETNQCDFVLWELRWWSRFIRVARWHRTVEDIRILTGRPAQVGLGWLQSDSDQTTVLGSCLSCIPIFSTLYTQTDSNTGSVSVQLENVLTEHYITCTSIYFKAPYSIAKINSKINYTLSRYIFSLYFYPTIFFPPHRFYIPISLFFCNYRLAYFSYKLLTDFQQTSFPLHIKYYLLDQDTTQKKVAQSYCLTKTNIRYDHCISFIIFYYPFNFYTD